MFSLSDIVEQTFTIYKYSVAAASTWLNSKIVDPFVWYWRGKE
jgi:hypothetical protein